MNEAEQNMEVQQRIETFLKEYNELCTKFSLRVVAIPKFLPENEGKFSIGVEYKLANLPPLTKEGETK